MGDSRPFLYGAFAILLFLVWQTWEMDQRPPATETVAAPPQDAASAPPPGEAPPPVREDVPQARLAESKPDKPRKNPEGKVARGRRVHVRTDVLDLQIDVTGGNVVQADLPRYPVSLETPDQPMRLLYFDDHTYVAQSGLTYAAPGDGNTRAPDHYAAYEAAQWEYDFSDATEARTVTLSWQSPDGVAVFKRFRFQPGSYLIEVAHEVHNRSDAEWVGRQYRQLRRSAGRMPDRTEVLFGNTEAISFVGGAYHDAETYHKISFEDMQEEPFQADIQDGWVAMLQHYFVSAWVPQRGRSEHFYTRVVHSSRYPEYIIGMHSEPTRVAPGERKQLASELYVGPKAQNVLEEIADGLDLTVDYGVLTILAKPLFWILDLFYGLFLNWGVAIIMVTVLIKLAFFKLSETSYRSMAKMRKFAPRIQQLRERYAGDRAKMNEAMMKMYREEKVNPLGGCWPILVQIPVFIALYWVLLESVELRQAPFFGWIHDLSVRDPYYVLPVLMGASMLVQTKLNPPPPDPFQAKLMLMMPLVFTVFFLFFPAGLVLYWLVNNLLSIAQQWYIIRQMER